MSWWASSRYQTFVGNVTTITAAFLNAVQDAIIDIGSGAKTLRKVHADGVGNQASGAADGQIYAKHGFYAEDGGASPDAVYAETGDIRAATGGIFANLGNLTAIIGN